jgi:hypothetical protein
MSINEFLAVLGNASHPGSRSPQLLQVNSKPQPNLRRQPPEARESVHSGYMDAAGWAKQSGEAQGLPEMIEDEVILTRVLVLAGLATPPPPSQDGRSEPSSAEEEA